MRICFQSNDVGVGRLETSARYMHALKLQTKTFITSNYSLYHYILQTKIVIFLKEPGTLKLCLSLFIPTAKRF